MCEEAEVAGIWRRTPAGCGGDEDEFVGLERSRLDFFGGEEGDDAADLRGLVELLRRHRSGGATTRWFG